MSKAIFQITAQNNHFDMAIDSNYIFLICSDELKKNKENNTHSHTLVVEKS